MPSTAKVLRFPGPRRATFVSLSDPEQVTKDLLATPLGQRSSEVTESAYSDPEVLALLLRSLRSLWEKDPTKVSEEASNIYGWLSREDRCVGLFDETEYFRGEAALIAGTAFRFLGRLEDADRWFNRAEAGFRLTINPGPVLANVSYARLTLQYMKGLHADILELAPSLTKSFNTLGMLTEAGKCQFLEAKSLQQLGRQDEAVAILHRLRSSESVREDRGLYAHVLIYIGNHSGSVGDFKGATEAYEEALGFVETPVAVAELKWSVGDTYRSQGRLINALEAYREAQRDFAAANLTTYVALLGLVASETLLALNRPREAEWEILSALPTIEEQKMVAEGFAAVALLKESVRQRKTDPNALRELREHLQAANQK